MSRFSLLLKTYLKFYVSTRRFLVIVPIYLFLALIFPVLVLAGVTSNAPDVYAYTQLSLSNFSFATALVAGLLAGDALSQDFSRQGLFTLTQPIRRSVIMLARFGSATIASIIVVVLAFLLPGFAFGEVFYQSIVPSAPEILGLSLVFIASMVAFVILFSSLFKSPTISIVLALVLVWIVMPTISSLLPLVSIEPWFLVSYASSAVADLAAKTYPQHVQQLSGGGFGFGGGAGAGSGPTFTTYNPTVPEALAIMLAYLLVSLILAWTVYSRRELKDVSS